MGVNSLPKTVTRQRRDCDLNPGPSAPEFSMLMWFTVISERICFLRLVFFLFLHFLVVGSER